MQPVPVPDIAVDRADEYRRRGYWGRPMLARILDEHAREAPARLALVDTFGSRLTYGELARAVRSAADWFGMRGVRTGDAVVMALPNCADYAVAHLALSRIGAVSVLLGARDGARDVAHAARETDAKLVLLADGPKLLVTLEHLAGSGHLADASATVATQGAGSGAGATTPWPGHAAFAETPSQSAAYDARGDEVELVVFSSGTTGRPKGIAHTYDGAGASLWGWIKTLGLTWRDPVFCPATFGHVGGSQWGLRTAVATGAPLVVMDRWNPVEAVHLIDEHKCSYTLLTPTYVTDLMRLPPDLRELTRSFRIWAVGGSRMPPTFVEDAEARLGGQLLRGFGMSEAFMLTITRPDDPVAARRTRDGRALPGYEIEVWDESDRPIPLGVAGEMVVRGPSLIGGYFTDPDESRRTFIRGWQRTGDVVVMDEEGFITVVDRRKELIIRGGENISPQELEQILAGHSGLPPLVVVGVPDDRLGEKVAVVYQGEQDALTIEQLQALLSSTGVARYKWPEVLVAVDELPRTSLGKIQRGGVRRLLHERLPAAAATAP